MNTYRPDANWWRSSFCGASAGCLEASRAGRLVLVRDSKTAAATGLIQQWTADEWVDLLSAVKLGVNHVGIDPIDGGVWFGLHRHETVWFTDNEWEAFVGGVIEGEFKYELLPSYASTLSSPASSEGCDAGQPVGVGGGSNQIAATGAGAIAVPPVPVAASWDPTSPQHAVIRAAIKWRKAVDDLDADEAVTENALIEAVDALPHIGEPVPVAAQPVYILDSAAIIDMVQQYHHACISRAPDRAVEVLDAIRAALTPVPTVEPEPRWGAGPLVEHVPEAPAALPGVIAESYEHCGPIGESGMYCPLSPRHEGDHKPLLLIPGTGSAVPDSEEIERRNRLAETWAEVD